MIKNNIISIHFHLILFSTFLFSILKLFFSNFTQNYIIFYHFYLFLFFKKMLFQSFILYLYLVPFPSDVILNLYIFPWIFHLSIIKSVFLFNVLLLLKFKLGDMDTSGKYSLTFHFIGCISFSNSNFGALCIFKFLI